MTTDQLTTPRPPPRTTPHVRPGDGPFPRDGSTTARTGGQRVRVVLTGVIVVAPLVALASVLWLGWGRAFPALCVVSLTLPFAVGRAITGTWYAGATAFLWAGLIRVCVLQHITWSVNSLCHPSCARHGREPGQIDLSADR